MKYQIPKEVKNIMNKFSEAGYQIYIVGGAVRDILMGKPVSDWDFTTDTKPEEILKLFPDGFYDNKFGTVGVQSVDSSRSSVAKQKGTTNYQLPTTNQIYEITTMRKEGVYQDHRHPLEVFWTNKLEEDLARRDFTINSMALRLRSGSMTPELIDIFQGEQDLAQKLIKAVGDPDKRFSEDALRIIRAFRLVAQLGFQIEEKTFQSTVSNAHLLSDIAWERIRDELLKLLLGDNATEALILMRQAGVLKIILPELEACFGVTQEGPKHTRVYDIGEHSLLTLKNCPSKDSITLLAALLHDIGKPDTVKVGKDGNVTFYQHDVVGGNQVLKIARRFNLSKAQTDKLYKLVRYHLFTVDEKQTDSAIRRFIKNIGVENIDNMMDLRVGDRLGGGTQNPTSWRTEKFKERIKQVLEKPFSISDLKVNGNDVMEILNIPPSRKVGEILEKLFEEVLEDNSKNEREYLLERIQKINGNGEGQEASIVKR